MDISFILICLVAIYSFLKLLSYSKHVKKKGNIAGFIFVVALAVAQMSLVCITMYLSVSVAL